MNFDLAETDCYGSLWLAVLVQAVEDATIRVPDPVVHEHNPKCPEGCKRLQFTEEHYYRRTAMQWFNDRVAAAGSFEWICSHMDIDADLVRQEIDRRREDLGISKRRRRISKVRA